MLSKSRHLVLIALACGGLVLGCGEKDASEAPDERTEPRSGPDQAGAGSGPPADRQAVREAVLAFVRAQAGGDGKALSALTDVSAEARGYIEALGPSVGTMYRFHEAGVKAYGKTAWVAAQLDDAKTIPPMLEEARTHLQVKVTGDRAEAELEGSETLTLVRRGGRWLVRPPMDVPATASERVEMVRRAGRFAEALAGPAAMIGRPGMSAETVTRAAKAAINQILGG